MFSHMKLLMIILVGLDGYCYPQAFVRLTRSKSANFAHLCPPVSSQKILTSNRQTESLKLPSGKWEQANISVYSIYIQ